ncbi:MAG: MFS transporter [Pseudomonadales bacterium]|nr:MFS transporter [Pseudomonadales bacterium]MCP5338492.1 MFS transporter [Pseudomonadales bacterium]
MGQEPVPVAKGSADSVGVRARLSLHERPWYPGYVLFVLLLAYIFSFIDRQILSLMVGPIRRDLQISDFEMSLLQGWAFALFYSVMALPIARLADRYDRRSIIATGIALWSAMTVGCGVVRGYMGLFLMRVGVGVGEAALSPPAYSLLSDYFPPERLGRAMAIFALGISVGGGAAYLIGGAVVHLVSEAEPVLLPLIGTVRPWQITFFVVGLPGLVVALMMRGIREPERRGGLMDADGEVRQLSLAQLWRYLTDRWRLYLSFPLATALLGVFSYGLMAWYPTVLIRTYGMTIAEAGTWFGLTYLVFGTAGTYSGARMAEWLERRGHRDAHIRFIMLAAIVMTLPGVLGPLMPTAPLALAALAPTIFLKCSYYGSSSAAMQIVTPNQMRAQVTALQIFFGNIIGMSVGASSIAALTDFVFQDDAAVRYSLAWVTAVACPAGALVLWSCLRPYVAALDEAARRPQQGV